MFNGQGLAKRGRQNMRHPITSMSLLNIGWMLGTVALVSASVTDHELQKRSIVEGTGSLQALSLRWMENAVQLGKAFSSNSSGDGPEEDDITGSCNVCLKARPLGQRACHRCNRNGVKSSKDECAVCNAPMPVGSRRCLTESQAKQAHEFVNSPEGTALYESLSAHRDLRSRPVRAEEWICRKTHCLSRAVEASERNKKGKGAQVPKGRRPLAPSNGRCDACDLPQNEGETQRGTGANTDSMNWFFRDLYDKTRDKENRVDLSSSSRICQDCYRAWYRDVAVFKISSTGTGTAQHTGPHALLVQQKMKDRYVQQVQAHLDESTPDSDACVRLSREKLIAEFRRRILSECFYACDPITKDDLCVMLEKMVVDDPVGRKMGIVDENDPDRTHVKHAVEDSIKSLKGQVSFGTCGIRSHDDRRKRVITLFPWAESRRQLESIVSNMQTKIEALRLRVHELEQELSQRKEDEAPSDDDVARTFAARLRVASSAYANAGESEVMCQVNEGKVPRILDPRDEYLNRVPGVLQTFLECLGKNESPLEFRGNETREEEVKVMADASRKCIIAGILASFAHRTFYFNANAVGLFLRGSGTSRMGIDWLSRTLRLTVTDSHLWRLTEKMAKATGDGLGIEHVVPRSDAPIAVSFDNINWSIKRHFARNGRFDGIAAIAHVPSHGSPDAVEDDAGDKSTDPSIEDRFGCTSIRISLVWDGFMALVTRCVCDVMNSDPKSEQKRRKGDFEVRIARAHISRSAPDKILGSKGRKIGQDFCTYYLGVEESTTKTLPAIMTYLDLLKMRLGVGVEGGRKRAVVAGDQETYHLMQQAIKNFPVKYAWIIPWVGDWHLLLHVLDAIFRRWEGFGIMKLAEVAGMYDKTLECKGYHKRHNLLMSVLEAVWLVSMEREGLSHHVSTEGGVEALLSELRKQRDGGHKTFGQWMEFLLGDGMAYLALHVAIRTGDFELRDTAIRHFAPKFMGYGKNKYNQLCMMHLNDLAKLTSRERSFVASVFSLSVSGIEGKNIGLDEVQEMTMNRELKSIVRCVDSSFIRKLALVIQSRASCVDDFKAHYAPDLIRQRKLVSSKERAKTVGKMKEFLRGEHCPLHQLNKIGRERIVALDGRVADNDLESAMFSAEGTVTEMWGVGVINAFQDTPGTGTRDKDLPKRPRLDTFSTQPPVKRSKSREVSVKDKHIRELRRLVSALQGVRKELGVPGSPILISGMPPQMGWADGSLCKPQKSGLIRDIPKYAPQARSEGIPVEDHCPHLCIVDMATIIHSVPPKGKRGETGDAMQFTEWKEYCAHVTKHFIVESCARGGARAHQHPEVILCLDKRSMVPPVKAFAHAIRLGDGGAVSNGKKGRPKRGKGGEDNGVQIERVWTDNIPKFDLRGRPPRWRDWDDFLSERQNRDHVFSLLCQYIRGELEEIKAAIHRGSTDDLSEIQSSLFRLVIEVDGEPVLNADSSSTQEHKSWRTDGVGNVTSMAENGIGEGELQALHHAWLAARQATDRRVEIVSIDSDVCIAALLCLACDPSVRGLQLAVRQQRGVYGRNYPHININELFNEICAERYWPDGFGVMDRCLPFVAAYILCGTDFTPTLRSISAAYMFHAYRGYAVQPMNAAFVKPLSAGWTGPDEDVFNEQECVKLVGLAYFKKHQTLFKHTQPGKQAHETRQPGRQESEAGRSVDGVEEWIDCIHNRTRESRLEYSEMPLVSPEYEVIDLHVKRAEWVAKYWLSSVFGVERYPVEVPSWIGQGYLEDVDGTVLVHLRNTPHTTITPAQRMTVVTCNCQPGTQKNKCRKCKCGSQGFPCSVLCKCKLSCEKQRDSPKSNSVTNEGEGEIRVSTECEHGGGSIATVGHDRSADRCSLSNSIPRDEDSGSGDETQAVDESVCEVDDTMSIASAEESSGELLGFAASDIAEYSTLFDCGSHGEASLPNG